MATYHRDPRLGDEPQPVRQTTRETVVTSPPDEYEVLPGAVVPPVAAGAQRAEQTSVVEGRSARSVVTGLIGVVAGIIEALVLLRLVLRLLGAGTGASFTRLIYDITAPLVRPFTGMFDQWVSGNSVFEPETLIALIVYAVAAWLLMALMRAILPARTSSERFTQVRRW